MQSETELVEALRSVPGVVSIEVTERPDRDIEDLYVRLEDPAADAMIWHNVIRKTSRAFILDAQIEEILDAELLGLLREIAAGRFSQSGA